MQNQIQVLKSWLDATHPCNQTMELKYTKDKGRYLVSKRDLKEGEWVGVSAPYVLTPNEARKQFVCDYCSGYDKNDINKQLPFHCADCNEVYYCSEQCQLKAKETWHAYECKCFQILADRNRADPLHQSDKKMEHLFCLAKFLARIFLLRTIEKISNPASNNDNNSHGDHNSHYRYCFSDVECLCSNVDIIPEKKLKIMQKVSKLVHQSVQQFYREQKSSDKQQQTSAEVHSLLQSFVEPSYEEILSMACREESNAFGVYYPLRDMIQNNELDDSSETRLFAFGFYPIPSLCNHSCGPNLYKILKGTSYYLYALHDIAAGTELCHAYIDLDKNTNQRRTELYNHYGFYCSCRRCEDDDIEDKFMKTFICSKYGCGGLLIKHVENLPEFSENLQNDFNSPQEETTIAPNEISQQNTGETSQVVPKKKKKKSKKKSSNENNGNTHGLHKNLKNLKLSPYQRICHKCRTVAEIED